MNLNKLLLKKNMGKARVAGFALANFIGLAIVMAGLQFFIDARPLWQDDDSFIRKDYLVVNKKVTSENTLGDAGLITRDEIRDLQAQPWVRKIGIFRSADYRVSASVSQGGRGMSTAMFFESLPDEFVDAAGASWRFSESGPEVPVIISKDYLTLYNFGFATSAGLPQMSEQIMSAVPLQLTLQSEDGTRTGTFQGRVVGYSNRLNTILVPDAFMDYANARFGSAISSQAPGDKGASRLIVDVSSPGDVAIGKYLEDHGLETAGDKSSSRAAFLLRVVTGIILAVGIVITLLSFFILVLSVSLLMEKSRDKIHTLLELGYPLRAVARPYSRLIVISTLASYILAGVAVILLRGSYIAALTGLTASPGASSSTTLTTLPDIAASLGDLWQSPLAGLVLTIAIIAFGLHTVRRRVASAWR